MPAIFLFLAFALQATAAVLAARTPPTPKTRNVIRVATAMFALMATRTLFLPPEARTAVDASPAPWTEALLELTVAGLALGGVLGLRRARRDDGSAMVEAGHREVEQEIRSRNADLEERVRERTRELKRAIEELEAFTYSVSHDLRSPLRAMAGYSQMVLDEDGDNLSQASRDELARIRASSVRMAGLIDGLLSLSRLTRRKCHDVTVDLTASAHDVVAELRRLDPSREVEVTIEEGLTAVADPVMMSLVLQHLLSNAWKFTRHTGDARIEFRCEDGDVFCVRDNGVGFDPSQAAKMFRPFQRQHHSDEFEGNGIGLATVGRIVRHYGGRVWADGAIGNGSTFRFTLKRDADEAARTAA
jgi:signal transduction histidine kinase